MNIPLMDLKAQYLSLKNEIMHAIERVIDSGQYIGGPEVRQFEQEMAAYTKAKYAVSTANGTDALVLALDACGIGPGDEVITSPYTFFATAEAIARVGATPIFADIDEKTYNLCPEKTEEKVTEKTKAIIPVHIFGQPADMEAFMDIAKLHNLYVIEDACQALGATYKGEPVGSIGHVGCVSFFPTKNLGGYGDGGIVVTNSKDIAEKVRLLAHHGSRKKYYHEIIGYNSRLDELQAAILRIKLKHLNEWNKLRQQKAAIYSKHLQDLELIVPFNHPDVRSVYHLYIIQSEKRQQLADYLKKKGVATGHYYPCPLHLQKAFSYLGYKESAFPISEVLSRRAVALPMFPQLKNEQQEYIISVLKKFTGESR
ncbi:dTDP-4-amino-4,6-dideoxygalactose transaminase [Evansella vedderi]|uniref:dTDP-4-amino-4,6-dideoxygalactose transaminase n=1 Tax=Evansella vedderi TaxID=38282 RepID=A0ABT9ZVT1_9BACI|nr:DegT/DnrJ/EryC1/StrS family aminotransferase [Evansella vedderi]MDQ0255345.1 dTDP-4-amino-4,6-dideoxygalactose transaminase [Evansella vedderi]